MSQPELQPGAPVDSTVPAPPSGLPGQSYQLVVHNPLSRFPAQVFDSQGNATPLIVYGAYAMVSADGEMQLAAPGVVFQVQAPADTVPMMAILGTAPSESGKPEASVRFENTADQTAWHVGVGGNAGPGNFFVWNIGQQFPAIAISATSQSVSIQGSVDVQGGLTVPGPTQLKQASLMAAGLTITGIPPVSTAPPTASLANVVVDTNTGKLYVT